jgi:hypothetical protein
MYLHILLYKFRRFCSKSGPCKSPGSKSIPYLSLNCSCLCSLRLEEVAAEALRLGESLDRRVASSSVSRSGSRPPLPGGRPGRSRRSSRNSDLLISPHQIRPFAYAKSCETFPLKFTFIFVIFYLFRFCIYLKSNFNLLELSKI